MLSGAGGLCENRYMTLEQIILIGLLITTFGIFALDRFRIEVVAVSGLMAAFAVGLVPASSVFSGLAHSAVISVAEILILVGALQASHLLDRAATTLTAKIKSEQILLLLLCSLAGFVSIFMNNIGALALMLPLVTAVSERSEIPLSRMLMPISFATLLGGTCSLIGTPANLLVSDVLLAETGEGLGFFEFANVGLPALLVGVVAIVLFVPRLLPTIKSSEVGHMAETVAKPGRLILEANVPPQSSLAGTFLPLAESNFDGRIESIRRNDQFVFGKRETIRLEPGDALLIEGNREKLERLIQSGMLITDLSPNGAEADQGAAVVVPESVVLGSRISTLEGFTDMGVRIVAITSPRKRLEGSFSDLQLAVGDVIHLAGPARAIDQAIRDHNLLSVSAPADILPLRTSLPPLIAFFGAVALSASGLLRPELAFGAAIAGLVIFGQLDLISAIRRLNWPILIMLAAMIPIGNAVETTGLAEFIARIFLSAAPQAGPLFILFSVLITAVVITPFVNNASTAIILAPIAFQIAISSGIDPAIVLLAVAVGVSLDFVTPFGHHNNTIVMGICGYRFRDFPIAGWPVLLAVLATSFFALSVLLAQSTFPN